MAGERNYEKIELLEIRQVNDALAEMVALFRVELRSYKGIASKPNAEDGREEMKEYLLAGFPVFAATVHGEYAGYVVCRIESEVVWVESIFVREEYRRQESLPHCMARQKKLQLLMETIRFTTMSIPITTG